MDTNALPSDWAHALKPILASASFRALGEFVDSEREERTIHPPAADVFSAFRATSLAATRVFILGQDPYHGPGQAHGLCFSVRPGVKIPPSLRNIYKELKTDLGIEPVSHGYLQPWAEQGILMTNAVLTVREGNANSHKRKGWEAFTDGVIEALNNREEPVVFLLWGGFARKKSKLINAEHHVLIESAHPSPLSAHNGFWGSRPFSKVDEALASLGHPPIDWRLPDDPAA
ncbi:MAG: uracil-DNA glycosylase [Bradymonadia bacterium]|jgi:uracil-DNA glycosylase